MGKNKRRCEFCKKIIPKQSLPTLYNFMSGGLFYCDNEKIVGYGIELACTGLPPYPIVCPKEGIDMLREIWVAVVTSFSDTKEGCLVIDRDEDALVRNLAKVIFDGCKHMQKTVEGMEIRHFRREQFINTVKFTSEIWIHGKLDRLFEIEVECYSIILATYIEFLRMMGNNPDAEMDIMQLLELDQTTRGYLGRLK